MEQTVEAKSFRFAVRIVKLCRFLSESKKEFVLSRQLLRSGTSIGANIAEAQQAQSRADFISKLSIALKEAYMKQTIGFAFYTPQIIFWKLTFHHWSMTARRLKKC